MTKARPMPSAQILYHIRHANDCLDRYSYAIGITPELHNAIDKITWCKRYHKAPDSVLNAIIAKATAIFDGDWCGDEPEEHVICDYLRSVK